MNKQDKEQFEAVYKTWRDSLEPDDSINSCDLEYFWQAALEYRDKQNRIDELEHEIRLVRARNERLEKELHDARGSALNEAVDRFISGIEGQPAQEPVAFYYPDKLVRSGYGIKIKNGTPLYTAPPAAAISEQLLEALDWCVAEINRDSPAVINAKAAIAAAEKAKGSVNETPKNEHDIGDVLKRAPLVRLTDEEINSIEGHAYIAWKGNMQLDVQKIFAHAIMDAMDKKNGG